MINIKKTPKIDGSLGWYETSPLTDSMQNHLNILPKTCDYLIIGAGFSGLAVAGRLAELKPNASIVVVDSLKVGQGTSGRNAGFLIDVPHNLDSTDQDIEHDKQLMALNQFAIQRLDAIRKRFGDSVQWNVAGKYLCAHEESNFLQLEKFANQMRSLGESYDFLNQNQLFDRLGTSYYKKGIYSPKNVLINPASLVQAVALSLPSNVQVYEKTQVNGLEYGEQIYVHLDKGAITPTTLILATNAFSEEFGVLKNTMVPIFTYAGLTRPLTQTEVSVLGSNIAPWGVTSAHPAGSTVRFTPDRRLLIRNTLNFEKKLHSNKNFMNTAKLALTSSLTKRFPGLNHVSIEHQWGGMLCMTRGHQPVFKQIKDNIFMLGGMNGVGVAKGTYLGYYLAELICGKHSQPLSFILQNSAPQWVPPEPFKSIGIRARLTYEKYRAAGER